MQALKTVVITGANKGIGFGILENLIQKQSYKVIMACRSLDLAQKSRTQLIEKYNLSQDRIDIIELDISSSDSIDKFIQEFTTRFHQADILINNAAVAVKSDDFNFEIVQYTFIIKFVSLHYTPNFYGTVELTEKFIPLLVQNGKIITIGSSVGNTKILESDDLVKRFKNPNITRDDVFKLADEFQEHVKNSTIRFHLQLYFIFNSLLSKFMILILREFFQKITRFQCIKICYIQIHMHRMVGQAGDMELANYSLILMSRLQHQMLMLNKKIYKFITQIILLSLYTCCPGWVKTDMAAEGAVLTIEQGALTPVYLVELQFEVNPAYQGQFFYLQKVQEL